LLSGGLADPATIYTGGSETVSSGGTDDGAQISGGMQYVYGLTSGVDIFTGVQVVEIGGTASNTIVHYRIADHIASLSPIRRGLMKYERMIPRIAPRILTHKCPSKRFAACLSAASLTAIASYGFG